MTPLIQIALTLFIIANPIGNCPTIVALIKNHPIEKQRKILLRESFFALVLSIFFLFLGETFLKSLQIQEYALTLSGGILLFLIGLKMIFINRLDNASKVSKKDPFIVPIATPMIAGGGLLAMLMLYSKKEQDNLKVLLALLLAWVGVTLVLWAAPYMQLVLGKRGLTAMEQLMGMLLCMISMEMIVSGSAIFISVLKAAST